MNRTEKKRILELKTKIESQINENSTDGEKAFVKGFLEVLENNKQNLKRYKMNKENRMVRFANDFNVLLENKINENIETIKGVNVSLGKKDDFISCFLSLVQILVDEAEARYPIKEEEIYKYYKSLVDEGRFPKNNK